MARVLVRTKIKKAILKATDGLPDDDLPEGHLRLYSYFKPSLEAGLYGIEARQRVSVDPTDPLSKTTQPLYIWNYTGANKQVLSESNLNVTTPAVVQQQLSVVAPQFSLDPKVIDSFYPPPGHQDEGRILPHIVFNDPHMPWVRYPGLTDPFHGPVDFDSLPDPRNPPSPRGFRNMVPWMALLVFDPDELKVTPGEASSTGLAGIPSYDSQKLPLDGAFPARIGDYLSKITTNRIYYEAVSTEFDELKGSKDMTSIIFPTRQRLEEILGNKASLQNLSNQKFMAHVRHIKTAGMPDAGVQEDGFYSVVVSSMTGGVKSDNPVPQVVHLVSLEHYDSTVNNPLSPFNLTKDGIKPPAPIIGPDDRVGIVSLYSWIYTCIPQPVDFVATMEKLTAKMQPLRSPDSLLQTIQAEITTQPTPELKRAASILYERLGESYTLCRWRTATGEETVAYNRGPLVACPTPKVPTKVPTDWPALSMSGKDYQIFDQEVGIMDLTYASAWSLGRLTAVSDSPFNAALLRFRSLNWKQAASQTRMSMNGITSKRNVLAQLSSAIQDAQNIHRDTFTGPVARLNPPSHAKVAPPLTHPDVAPTFATEMRKAVNTTTSDDKGEKFYSDFELAKAANSDWELIHNWISDCLYLGHIPAHVLFPEPSYIKGEQVKTAPQLPNVPPEALRFFHVDHAWIDAFIDGALSCANHLDPIADKTRLYIKEVYNYYLRSDIHPLEGQTPPIPRYGFVLRSSAVKAIPDMKIAVSCRKYDVQKKLWVPDKNRDPIIRLTRMDLSTILCLLDCLPEEIDQITITQPPHQQRYAMGAGLKAVKQSNGSIVAKTDLQVKMLYTTAAPDGTWPTLPHEEMQKLDQSGFYHTDARCIDSKSIADNVRQLLTNSVKFPNDYVDAISNSSLLGLVLNDPCYKFIIAGPPAATTPPPVPWTRQLWTGTIVPPGKDVKIARRTVDGLPSGVVVKRGAIQRSLIALPPLSTKTIRSPTGFNAPHLHSAQVIPSKTLSTPVRSGLIEANFTLIIHPDYRPPPPTPLMATSGINVYAPMDYLPTKTVNLYDIVIAIRRKLPTAITTLKLAELIVELPVSDGTDAPINGRIREPLIAKGYRPPGISMTSNQHFIPTISTKPDPQFPLRSIFVVTLSPRSDKLDATILVTADGRTDDASVRLSDCPVADVVDTTFTVPVAQVDAKGHGTKQSKGELRGVCKLKLHETYVVDDKGTRVTVTTDGEPSTNPRVRKLPLWALKKASGDLDLTGQEV